MRGLAVYFFLLLVFRISGKRGLGQITTFDFVLLLIVAETTQQALVGEDFSITNAFILIATLLGAEIGLTLLKREFPRADRVLDGMPLIIFQDGKPLRERLKKERVDEEDILSAARKLHGLERLDQIKYAVLERDGGITIIPR